jgi:glycosyltransferase involved in cell wall biosynthesis
MKILLVHNKYQLAGGEDTVVAQERQLLEDHNHVVVPYSRSNEDVSAMDRLQKATMPINAVWSRSSLKEFSALVEQEQPDVIHVHNTHYMMSPAIYYATDKIPIVQTLHNYRLMCPSAVFYRDNHVCEDCLGKFFALPGVMHKCFRESRAQSLIVAANTAFHRAIHTWDKRIHAYIALTDFMQDKLVSGGLPAQKIHVKPHFVQDPGVQKTSPGDYFLYVGRLSDEKGILDLIQAFATLPSHIPLKVAGTGPLEPKILAQIESQGIKSIELLGNQSHDRVLTLMRSARALIFPSVCYETFGMAIIEAFSIGLPVIGSDLGSRDTLIQKKQAGIVYETGNIAQLSEKALWAWDHPNEMLEMGRKARQVYLQQYTPDVNYRRLMEIYDKARETLMRA